MNVNNDFISIQNQTVLHKRAKEIWETAGLGANNVNTNVGFWSTIASYMPFATSQDAGRFIGFAVSQTHGADLSNATIQLAVRHLFPKEDPSPKNWRQAIIDKIQGVAEPTIEEIAELVITPKVLPFVQMFLVNAGGIAIPAAVMLISSVYQRCLGSQQNKLTLEKMPDMDTLMKVDKETQKIYTASGRELSPLGFKDIVKNVKEYDIICKILKSKNANDIYAIIDEYTLGREDGIITFKNGKILSAEDIHNIEKGIERIKDENLFGKEKSLLRLIKLLRNNSQEVSQNQTILNGSIIRCDDGIYCDREGKIISPDEVQVRVERDRAIREDLRALNADDWVVMQK